MTAQARNRSQHLHDEMLICERCGVSFLWTVEEQRRRDRDDPAPPSHCPGCRHLLPPPGWERGVVKWYSTRKKYGFIVRHEGAELFAHRSRFAQPCRLHPGDLVEFRVEEGEQGPMAVDLRLLLRASEIEALAQRPPSSPAPASETRRKKRSS